MENQTSNETKKETSPISSIIPPTLTAEQEIFIKKWSWGAFFLQFIWAFGSRLYVQAMLMLIASIFPIVNLGVAIYFGIKGRQAVWKEAEWESFDLFQRRQKLLDKIGFWVFIIGLIVPIVLIAGLIVYSLSAQK
jgi:hypothetical protein